jgi:uncharacterized protein YgiM (DUF1202 family)
MKKRTIFLIISLFLFCLPLSINASYDATISDNYVRIRKTATTKENNILYTVNKGTEIKVVDKTLYSGSGCSKKWYKVTYKDKTGYVCSTYVKFVEKTFAGINTVDYTARVNANNVTVRKSATTKSDAISTLSLGVNVTILDKITSKNSNCTNDTWYKISYYKNKTGYICAKYVTKKSDITANDEEYTKTLLAAGFTDVPSTVGQRSNEWITDTCDDFMRALNLK